MGLDGMTEGIAQAPRLEAGISVIFGSARTFGYWVIASYLFSIVAHGIDAGIAFQLCSQVLELDTLPTFTWTMLVFSVGYPIFSRLQAFA